jgi:hypothetical protein
VSQFEFFFFLYKVTIFAESYDKFFVAHGRQIAHTEGEKKLITQCKPSVLCKDVVMYLVLL